MKIKELLESATSSLKDMAWGALHDEADEIKSYLEDTTDFNFSIAKKNEYLVLSTSSKFPEIMIKFDIETRGTSMPKDFVLMTLVLDVDKASVSLVTALRKYLKSEHNRETGVLERPWYFDDHSRYSVDRISILEVAAEPKVAPIAGATPTAPRYDPKQAYQDRMTPAAKSRQHAISNHQFRNSIGGDSSNYR